MHLTFICRYSGRTRDDPYAPCTHGKLAFGGNHVILAPLDVLSIISHMSTIIYLFFKRSIEGKRLAFHLVIDHQLPANKFELKAPANFRECTSRVKILSVGI